MREVAATAGSDHAVSPMRLALATAPMNGPFIENQHMLIIDWGDHIRIQSIGRAGQVNRENTFCSAFLKRGIACCATGRSLQGYENTYGIFNMPNHPRAEQEAAVSAATLTATPIPTCFVHDRSPKYATMCHRCCHIRHLIRFKII